MGYLSETFREKNTVMQESVKPGNLGTGESFRSLLDYCTKILLTPTSHHLPIFHLTFVELRLHDQPALHHTDLHAKANFFS